MRKLAMAAILPLLIYGCTGVWHPGASGGGLNLNSYCDKEFTGDMKNGTIIGVYRCGDSYRLVFDSLNHNDYYVTGEGQLFAECPAKNVGEECSDLLESCKKDRFINLCR
ncbi:MAG: hypothetical protein ABIF01_03905 [Candidatus Micrarchaeota archaeon]